MSSRPAPTPDDPASYPEAVAQWRLAVRTEVKRASALPTAVFDTCDPMIETQLAQTAEAMLSYLHEPTAVAPSGSGEESDKRLEPVTADELRRLPPLVAPDALAVPDLDAGTAAEYLAVLADACDSGDAAAVACALALLQRDFDLEPGPTDQAAKAVVAAVGATLVDGALDLSDLDRACARLRAALAAATPKPIEGDA